MTATAHPHYPHARFVASLAPLKILSLTPRAVLFIEIATGTRSYRNGNRCSVADGPLSS